MNYIHRQRRIYIFVMLSVVKTIMCVFICSSLLLYFLFSSHQSCTSTIHFHCLVFHLYLYAYFLLLQMELVFYYAFKLSFVVCLREALKFCILILDLASAVRSLTASNSLLGVFPSLLYFQGFPNENTGKLSSSFPVFLTPVSFCV